MIPVLTSFYAQWRVQSGAVPLLREDDQSPPERLLQTIWQHQRLVREKLRTIDGVAVQVLHPGFQNREGGPDFRGAVIQVGEEPPVSGDVEVDLRSSGWKAHGHDRNPAFARVILHVVWQSEQAAAGGPPAVVLRDVLDAPLGELSLWLGGEQAMELPVEWRGQCCAPLSQLSAADVQELLLQAARVRLQSKAAGFQARSRQVGWEQALWEGLFRGLGYKHNVWPMQRLAELRPRWCCDSEAVAVQARLFGISGLLPADLTRTQLATDDYLRVLWSRWWRERDAYSDCLLPKNLWRLHGLRPANHPHRRLALGAGWTVSGQLPTRLERWCATSLKKSGFVSSLARLLQTAPDDFWSWHWTLKSARMTKPHPMLGDGRVTDLAINVILPWLWIRAVEGKTETLQREVEQRYFSWPPAEDNSVLKLARQRLLGTTNPRTLPTAAIQQGLIQVVRDFCDHSNSICEACKLPDLARAWPSRPPQVDLRPSI